MSPESEGKNASCAKKENKGLLCTPAQKQPSMGRVAQTPGAGKGDVVADFAVIGVELCSTINAIFLCVALS